MTGAHLLVAISVSILFSVFKLTPSAPIHPVCDARFTPSGVQPTASSVTDITSLFTGLDLPEGACVFNPAVVHVVGQVYCVFARVYSASEPAKRCAPGRLDRSPFLDGWRGQSTNLMAVVRLQPWPGDSKLNASLLGYTYMDHTNLEDGRLFKDARGRIFVYLALPMGSYPKRAVVNTVQRVFIRCSRTTDTCKVSLGVPRWLPFFGSPSVMDKNWVPWNGTAFMSFSHYGTFGPHSVFNWGTYDDPLPHTGFAAVAEDSVFTTFAARYGKLLHLAGGSPAVLEPSGASFLAVGHLKAHPGCFHPEAMPAWAANASVSGAAAAGAAAGGGDAGGGAGGVRTTCAHLARAGGEAHKSEVLKVAFDFTHEGGKGIHYPLDYAFFLYRFTASPPYNVTHISYGFLPYTWRSAVEHTGIVFPIGLERLGAGSSESGSGPGSGGESGGDAAGGGGGGDDQYLIAYGDSDQVSRVLLLPVATAEAMLWPLRDFASRLDDYTVCSLPCAGEGLCA